MENVNQQVKHIILDKMGEKGAIDMIPLLEAWKVLEVKKIQSRIGGVIKTLKEKEQQRAERENDVVIAVEFENRVRS